MLPVAPINAMSRIRHLYFAGIGGSGMGGIAEVLLNQGFQVSGADLHPNAVTARLGQLGAKIYPTHDATQIKDVDVIVRSAAIPEHNPELIAAHQAHIPVIPRAMMLGELMRFRYGIAVAGTHGKTTTTSLIASIFAEAGLDPTFVIGGLLTRTGSHGRLGSSQYLIAEADESDASFLYLQPIMSVITNIDADHMETYGNDFQRLIETFKEFIYRLPFYGLAVVCQDDPVICALLPDILRPVRTYGFAPEADYRAYDYQQQGLKSYFTVQRPAPQSPLTICLNLGGIHNVTNALAAIAIASENGLPDEAIRTALENFAGVGRRLQIYGEYVTPRGNILLIDDYGHHPREITATLQAIRQAWPQRRLVMTYQPHRFTRTRDLFTDFVKVLAEVDTLLLLEVYAAGETPIVGADSTNLLEHIKQQAAAQNLHSVSMHSLTQTLRDILQHDDILLMQGAGDIGSIAAHLAACELQLWT